MQNARPEKWAHIETYVQLLPPPDGAYVIEFVYKVAFPPLINATDAPIIPESWHRGIYVLAASLYYGDEGGDPVKEKYHHDVFEEWVSNQPVEEHEETEGIDSGVEVPTLRQSVSGQRTPDGAAWDSLP